MEPKAKRSNKHHKGRFKRPSWNTVLVTDKTLVDVPSYVTDKLRQTCATLKDVQAVCGVSKYVAGQLHAGGRVYARTLNEVLVNLDLIQKNALKYRLESQIGVSAITRMRMLTYLEHMARLVYDYKDKLVLSPQARQYYVFPPRDVMSRLSGAIEAAHKQLRQMHDECPEYDYIIFRKAPKLLDEFQDKDKKTAAGRKRLVLAKTGEHLKQSIEKGQVDTSGSAHAPPGTV